jgi:type IV pilus assembly protein PilW
MARDRQQRADHRLLHGRTPVRQTLPAAAAPSHHQAGLSLLELLIAMTIGMILVITIGYAYIGAKQSFRTQDAQSRIQENARYAFESTAHDIRMAGYTGGVSPDATNRINIVKDPTAWDPQLKDLYGRPLLGDDDNPPKVNDCATPRVPACYLGGDIINVVRVDNDSEYDTNDATTNPISAITLAATEAKAPDARDILVLADYTRTGVFQASSVVGKTITITANADTPGNSQDNLGNFDPAAGTARKLYLLRGVTYYIASNPSGEPALYRRLLGKTAGEEILEGVERMTIRYGVDTDASKDGAINAYWTADEVTAGKKGTDVLPNEAPTWGTAVNGYWRRVLSVRITLTLVSRQGTNVTAGGLLRKTFTNTIAIRNRLS